MSTAYKTSTDTCSNFASFDVAFPEADTKKDTVTVVDRLVTALNPTDSSLDDIAASEIDCKLLTEQAVLDAFGEKGVGSEGGCKAANNAALHRAWSLAPSATTARYQRVGKPFVVEDDEEYSTGVTWEHGAFGFTAGASSVSIQSPILTSGSNVLCKLLSPARIVEYMMTDGLPRFDGTVP